MFYYEHGIPTAIYAKDLRPGNVLVGGSDKVQILPIFNYFFYLKLSNDGVLKRNVFDNFI